MKWLLFTNIETNINNDITRIRCCFTDMKFQRVEYTKDYILDGDLLYKIVEEIESELITNINCEVTVKDVIYLVCNLQTTTVDDSRLIFKKLPRLSKYIKENIDLSSLWLIMDMYELHSKNVDKIDYCMYKVFGSDNVSNNEPHGYNYFLENTF